ncbi:MAG: hypothetical protein CBB71_13345 [Rhodopirellula sp. TMED11]|nr:MAG: hypothetical protein CBB71_13345 [Rhodopirellula sp. TMED11]
MAFFVGDGGWKVNSVDHPPGRELDRLAGGSARERPWSDRSGHGENSRCGPVHRLLWGVSEAVVRASHFHQPDIIPLVGLNSLLASSCTMRFAVYNEAV